MKQAMTCLREARPFRIAVFRGGSDRVERICQKSQLPGVFPADSKNATNNLKNAFSSAWRFPAR